MLWRIAPLMIAATMAVAAAGYTNFAPHLMNGLEGMAFDQFTASASSGAPSSRP
jgi:hypothetical protein